mmetsp:Transcript_31379/g.50365  ORF Transcript_31379/g.50365 Transcript_31379/m.50365 type:complete len:125 (-) Transcript_31379:166-540(-)
MQHDEYESGESSLALVEFDDMKPTLSDGSTDTADTVWSSMGSDCDDRSRQHFSMVKHTVRTDSTKERRRSIAFDDNVDMVTYLEETVVTPYWCDTGPLWEPKPKGAKVVRKRIGVAKEQLSAME